MYYSERKGLRRQFGIEELRRQLQGTLGFLVSAGFLAEWAGYQCVDGRSYSPLPGVIDDLTSWVPGRAGDRLQDYVFAEVRRSDLFPLSPVANSWSEDQIFDLIEFLGRVVSKPMSFQHHPWGACGKHPERFNKKLGQQEYTAFVNRFLKDYGNGWRLSDDLQITALPPDGLQPLLDEELRTFDNTTAERVRTAVKKFQRRGASRDERRDAVLDLGAIFEKYREDAKRHLRATESSIFQLLNNFDLRHNNLRQRSDYDPTWMDGMFYQMLNLIHVLDKLRARGAVPGE